MISGRQALGQITGLKREQQGELTGLDQKIDGLGRQLMDLRRAQAEDYRALSRLRVDLIDAEPLTASLDAAEGEVAAMLERRDARAASLTQRLGEARDAVVALTQQREELADLLDAATARLSEAEAATAARLAADEAFQAQRRRALEAERTALHAGEKAGASEQEQAEKGAAYTGDPLFMYLWQRRFGTAKYRGFGPFRWLDGKVARLIGYADAALNYQRLLEIPPRLREHAVALTTTAEAALAELERLEAAAREADGLPPLAEAREAAAARVSAMDQEIAAAEGQVQALLDEEARLAAGDDEDTRAAVDHLATALSRTDLEALRRQALATPFPEDDAICERLLAAEQESRRLGFMLDNLKQTRAAQQRRLTELGQVEQEFKRRRMDQDGGGFSDAALLTMMLGNLINGMLDRDALIRVLEEQYRQPPRPRPSGGGTLGRGWGGNSGGSWGGGSGSGWGGGGSRGGGGFRTGGGTGGGGGFRTGGGF